MGILKTTLLGKWWNHNLIWYDVKKKTIINIKTQIKIKNK
jgi:hypothetical protein